MWDGLILFCFPLLFKALQTLDGLILKAASLVVPFLKPPLEPCPIGDRSHRRTVTQQRRKLPALFNPFRLGWLVMIGASLLVERLAVSCLAPFWVHWSPIWIHLGGESQGRHNVTVNYGRGNWFPISGWWMMVEIHRNLAFNIWFNRAVYLTNT